jgi:hypothetical protein
MLHARPCAGTYSYWGNLYTRRLLLYGLFVFLSLLQALTNMCVRLLMQERARYSQR